MMKKRYILEYHIERRRERSGKLKQPEDFLFNNYINAFLRNHDELEDILLVPITINYDKVYEGGQFPYELLGETKPKQSLLKVLKTFTFIKEKQGQVIVKYCKPVSLKTYMNEYLQKNNMTKEQLINEENEKVSRSFTHAL